MSGIRPLSRLGLIGLALAALLLGACGSSAGASGQSGFGPRRSATATAVAGIAVQPIATARPVRTAAPPTSPYTLVRTYTDANKREIKLFYGRGVGRSGDWGWAHIVGKHLKGEWADGGPITTFDVIGVTTPEAVQEIIGRAITEDRDPNSAARGRREYRLPVPNTRYEVLTVVGSDGAIITAYPDSPRTTR
jgi:hypothetical protein